MTKIPISELIFDLFIGNCMLLALHGVQYTQTHTYTHTNTHNKIFLLEVDILERQKYFGTISC